MEITIAGVFLIIIGMTLVFVGAFWGNKDEDLDLEFSQRQHGISKSQRSNQISMGIFMLGCFAVFLGFCLVIGSVIATVVA